MAAGKARTVARVGRFELLSADGRVWKTLNESFRGISRLTGKPRETECHQCHGMFPYSRGRKFCSEACGKAARAGRNTRAMRIKEVTDRSYGDRWQRDKYGRPRIRKGPKEVTPTGAADVRAAMRNVNWKPMGSHQVIL